MTSRSYLTCARLLICVLLAPLGLAPVFCAQEDRWKELRARARALDATGKYSEAISTAREGVDVAEITFGAEYLHLALSQTILAILYEKQDRYAEAEPLPPQEDRWKELNAQVIQLYQEGKFTEAIPLAEESVRVAEVTFGPESRHFATSLNNLALLYKDQGRYADAEPLYKRALAIDEKVLGPDHPDVALSLNNLAELYREQGKYADAEPLFKRALDIDEKALGPEHASVATDLNNLGVLYEQKGRYPDAEPLYKRALAIDEKVLGPDHPDVALSLNNLAELYREQGKYADAEPLYKRALAIREKALGPDHPDVALSLNNLAELYCEQGKYPDAEPLYKGALAIREKALGPDHPDVALSLNNLAALYDQEGHYADAEPLLKRALAIREKALGPGHPDVAQSLNNLAALYDQVGRYADAEPLYKRALAVREKALGPGHRDVAQPLNNLAALYDREGRYADAEPLLKRALAIREKALGPDHPDVALSLNNLAELYREQGKYADAEPLFKRALDIDEKALGPEHVSVATDLNNLALLYQDQGRDADAEQLFKRALDIDEKALGPEHASVATDLNNLGVLYDQKGRYADAEPLLKRALAIQQKAQGSDHPDVATPLTNLATMYYGQGKFAEAGSFFDRALQNLSKQFQYSFTYMSEKDRLQFLATVGNDFSMYFSFGFSYAKQDHSLAGKMYDLLLWEKGMVAESVGAQRARVAALGDPEATKLYDQLVAKRSQYAALAKMHPSDLDQWRKNLAQVEQEANDIDEQVTALGGTKPFARHTWQEVRQKLRKGEAAVEIARFPLHDGKDWTGRSRYAALVLTAGENGPVWIDLGDAATLEGRLPTAYYQRIAPPPSDSSSTLKSNTFAPTSHPLAFYNTFWKPLLSALGDGTRIYISTDGALNQVNLGMIPTPDGRLLMDKYDLRFLNRTADLLEPGTTQTNQRAVLFANPYFRISEVDYRKALATLGTPPQGSLPALVPSISEIGGTLGTSVSLDQPSTSILEAGLESNVMPLLKQQGWTVDPYYFGENALVEAVEKVQGPRLLHIGTHGDFLADPAARTTTRGEANNNPILLISDPMLRSRLYFAGAQHTLDGHALPSDLSDGILTAYQASTLNLHGTELVVLSACETGRGDVQNGEGVFGLRRAFQEAGAQSVLMSLWEVPAAETQELLNGFYYHWLVEGMDKHQALLAAQDDERKVVHQRYGSDLPYYWGAFVLVGK